MCSVTLKFSDSESFIGISPFLIAREIRTLVGEVLSAKPLATGELRIKTATQDQSERLLRTVRFLKKNITCQPSDRLRTTDAFAFAPSLVGVPQDELLAELSSQGVVGAYRLRPRNGKPNPGIRLTFSGASFPASIRAGFEDINLRPWLRNPLLCRHCSKYTGIRLSTVVPRVQGACAALRTTRRTTASLRTSAAPTVEEVMPRGNAAARSYKTTSKRKQTRS